MGRIYRYFSTIAMAAFMAVLFLSPLPASAADPLFTIENVEVDVTAENAIAAREEAFNQAQVKAFEELQKRMLPESEIATQPVPEPLTISTMIQDFEITNEKLSAVRYVGTYTFRFKDSAVRRFFGRSQTTYSDVSSKGLLVLPFMHLGSASTIWSPFNAWMRAWNRSGNQGGVVPLELPLGDLDDVRDIKDNQALSYNPQSLGKMLARYGADEAVIAIALPDDALGAVTKDERTAQGRLTVEIYRTDRRRPELVQQVSIIADGAQTRGQLYDAAVIRVRRALQKDWKAKTIVKEQVSNSLPVSVPITSLRNWVKIQTDLRRVNVVQDVVLKSLGPNEAQVDLLYLGDTQRLVIALQQSGMSLSKNVNERGEPVNTLSVTSTGFAGFKADL